MRTGFNFSRKGFNTELTHRLHADHPRQRAATRSGRRGSSTTVAATKRNQLTVDRVFPQVRLSTFSWRAVARHARRSSGAAEGHAAQPRTRTLAARAIGSEVGFTKTFLQGFVYRNLGRPHLVFAGGARLGLAQGVPAASWTSVDENGNPTGRGGARSAGERAVLRRRRHHDSRLRARLGRRARRRLRRRAFRSAATRRSC